MSEHARPSHPSDHNSLDIRSIWRTYRVHFLHNAINTNGYDAVIVDTVFADTLDVSDKPTLWLTVGESMKHMQSVEQIWAFLHHYHIKRHQHILIIGGGILHDVGGFACATYLRGIQWTYIPTTLIAMIDVAIGGKVAINYHNTKNLIGSFYPPFAVKIYPSVMRTLNWEQVLSGLLEIAKMAFIVGGDSWTNYCETAEQLYQTLHHQRNATTPIYHTTQLIVEQLILLGLRLKKHFIEHDEYDTGIRQLLNFGHTFGHAIEAASEFTIAHGIAVGIGMLMAVQFVMEDQRTFLIYNNLKRLIDHIRQWLGYDTQLFQQLINVLDAIDGDVFWKKFIADKKHTDKLNLIVPITKANNEAQSPVNSHQDASPFRVECSTFELDTTLRKRVLDAFATTCADLRLI